VGTASEWMRVLEVGALYGVLTFLWEAVGKRESFARPMNLAAVALTSLLFGMMMVFEWRVLHLRIVFVFAMAILGMFVLGLAGRRARKREEAFPKSQR
jgi:hypothetical protein